MPSKKAKCLKTYTKEKENFKAQVFMKTIQKKSKRYMKAKQM